MTKEQVLAVLASAAESLRAEIESRRAGELPRRIERDLREVDELNQARAAIASWPEPGEAVADPQLCQFYQVSTVAELLAAQEAHILQLQDAARRNVKPWEDTFPPTLLPKYMRDSGLAAPPSMSAPTNPKDSDAEASLRALLAELRGLEVQNVEIGGTEYNIVMADELAAILSRYPESKP